MSLKFLKNKIFIAIVITIILFITIPMIILAYEPDYYRGFINYHYAENLINDQKFEEAKKYLDTSLEYYPQNPKSQELLKQYYTETNNQQELHKLTDSKSLNPLTNYINKKITDKNPRIFDNIKSFQNKLISSFYVPINKIPTYRIYFEDETYQKFLDNPKNSKDEYVDCEIILPNQKKSDAECRLRGGNHWHYHYNKKSWRIKLDESYEGKETINLIRSRRQDNITYAFDYFLGSQAGLHSPDYQFVALYINDEYQGIRTEVEQIDQDFLKNHNLAAGDIYYGEIPNESSLKPDKDVGVFINSDYWDFKAGPENYLEDKTAIENLISFSTKNISQSSKEEVEKIVDIEQTLKYIALQNIINSHHIDSFHNFKLYLNPTTNKFEPIVWDLIDEYSSNIETPVTSTDNLLFNNILFIPELADKKNKYLWEYINNELSLEKIYKFIDSQAELLKYDIFFDPFKDYIDRAVVTTSTTSRSINYSDWKDNIDLLKEWLEKRYQFIKEELSGFNLTAYQYSTPENNYLIFDVTGEPSFSIEGLTDYNDIYRDTDFNFSLDNTDQLVNLSDEILYPGLIETHRYVKYSQLFLKRRLQPAVLRYQYIFPSGDISNLSIVNNITGEKITPEIININFPDELPELEDVHSLHPWQN